MTKVRAQQLLIYFQKGQKIAHDFLIRKEFTEKEIAESLAEQWIVLAGYSNEHILFSKRKQYTITDKGKTYRNS